nr:ORF46 [Bracoviriform inaniti]
MSSSITEEIIAVSNVINNWKRILKHEETDEKRIKSLRARICRSQSLLRKITENIENLPDNIQEALKNID